MLGGKLSVSGLSRVLGYRVSPGSYRYRMARISCGLRCERRRAKGRLKFPYKVVRLVVYFVRCFGCFLFFVGYLSSIVAAVSFFCLSVRVSGMYLLPCRVFL